MKYEREGLICDMLKVASDRASWQKCSLLFNLKLKYNKLYFSTIRFICIPNYSKWGSRKDVWLKERIYVITNDRKICPNITTLPPRNDVRFGFLVPLAHPAWSPKATSSRQHLRQRETKLRGSRNAVNVYEQY